MVRLNWEQVMQAAIGFDVGRSSVKIVAVRDGIRQELTFPSSVCPAFTINDDRGAARAAAETVLVGGKYFFIGETALLQGGDDLSGGLRDDWVYSEQHAALFLGGLNKLRATDMAGIDTALIVVGLPGVLYASQKAGLGQALGKLVPRAEIRVMPQPMGPYQQLIFTADGHESRSINADEDSYAVIEVGQYTTDFALLLHGHTIENAFGSCDGMRIAAEHLQRSLRQSQFGVSMAEATDLLRTRTLKNFGERIDVSDYVGRAVEPLAAQIVDKANQLIGKSARSLDGVLVAGGGAPLVLSTLQKAWPHARLSENSRFSVAEGFCRYSLAFSRYRNGVTQQHEETVAAR